MRAAVPLAAVGSAAGGAVTSLAALVDARSAALSALPAAIARPAGDPWALPMALPRVTYPALAGAGGEWEAATLSVASLPLSLPHSAAGVVGGRRARPADFGDIGFGDAAQPADVQLPVLADDLPPTLSAGLSAAALGAARARASASWTTSRPSSPPLPACHPSRPPTPLAARTCMEPATTIDCGPRLTARWRAARAAW